MKLNSTTFTYKRGECTYDSLESKVVSLAHDAKLSNVSNVYIHMASNADTINCSFKLADINAPVLPGTDNQQQPTEEIHQDIAAQMKSDAVLKYLEENQIQPKSSEELNKIIDAISQAPLTPEQLTVPTENTNPELLSQITQALNNPVM